MNLLLNEPIAVGLAASYKKEYANKVWKILKSWYKECVENWQKEKTNDRHQRLLRTVSTTYGQMQFDQERDALKIVQTLRRLHTILVLGDQPFVCQPTVIAIMMLSGRYFAAIEKEFNVLETGFSSDRGKQVVEVVKKVYRTGIEGDNVPDYLEFFLRTIRLFISANYKSLRLNPNDQLVKHTFESLFQILMQDPNESVKVAIRLLARQYFNEFISQLNIVASQTSEHQRQEMIDLLVEIYLDQRSIQEGGDRKVEIKGYEYPIFERSKRPPTPIEKAISKWLEIDKSSENQQQIAIETTLEFIHVLGTLDQASFSTGLIKDLEKYAPSCTDKQQNKFVNILTEIYGEQKRQSETEQKTNTDIEDVINHWIKNPNNRAIKEIALRASVEFESI